jgi:hypothetical protein
MICVLRQVLLQQRNREKINERHVQHTWKYYKFCIKFYSGNLIGEDQLWDLGIDRIILKLILKSRVQRFGTYLTGTL